MLSPQSMRMFIAVAEERHFARAADRLNVSQSVVSKMLQRLEDQLDMMLVNRSKRAAVTLTRGGELFLEEARAVIERMEKAERIGRNIARGEAGPLRLGHIFSAVMTGLVPKAIRALRDNCPAIEPIPMLMETPEQLNAIAAGTIDIGLVRPRPVYPPGIQFRIVHSERLIVGIEETHPLAAATQIRARDLAGQSFVIPQFHEQVGLIDAMRSLAKAGRFPMPNILPTSDFVTAASLAAAGMGVVIAPKSLERLKLHGLCYRTVHDHKDLLNIALIYSENTPAAALRSVLESLGPFPHSTG